MQRRQGIVQKTVKVCFANLKLLFLFCFVFCRSLCVAVFVAYACELKQQRHGDGYETFFIAIIPSCLIRLMLANVLECVFGLCQSSGKEKESCYLPRQNVKLNALSSCSRATTAKKCKKNVMHVQSCCFANINLLPLCRSHFRRLRRCSSSLLPNKLQLTDGKLQLTLINTKYRQ